DAAPERATSRVPARATDLLTAAAAVTDSNNRVTKRFVTAAALQRVRRYDATRQNCAVTGREVARTRRLRACRTNPRGRASMNLPELCIRRPVMTTLIMSAFMIFGVAGYRQLPVSALPKVDFPTISVTARLPGASPETMGATVATQLEKQFAT